jgi:tetratricopeptide (TPR) repeat protein
VWTLELGEPEAAKARWLALIELTDLPPAWAAHAWFSIGHLERVAFEDPAAAAAAFQQAVDIDADSPRAAAWLSDAARALSDDGQVDRAHQLWDTVARKYPAERALARIEQASLLFAKGQVAQAEELYQDAIVAAKSDHHLQVARLGANACRERLARVEEALAEIESDELDPELLELRRVQLSEGTQGPSDDL